jgi:hypothetical protein
VGRAGTGTGTGTGTEQGAQRTPWAFFLVALLASCTRATDEDRWPPRPDLLAVASTVPVAEAADVCPDVRLELCFSRAVDPRSVREIDASVSSGASQVDSDVEVQLVPWRGPGGGDLPSDAQFPWCPGSVVSVTPGVELVGGVLYRLRLDPNVSGWAGEVLDTDAPGWTEGTDGIVRFDLEFTVAADATPGCPGPSPEPEPITLGDLFAGGGPLDPVRGECHCHTQAGELAHARLDLSDADAAYAGLVLDPELRETGFPMVSPRSPSESFLLQKLMRDEDGEALHGILGDAMPQDGPLPYLDVAAIASWIDGGALR